MAVIIYLQGSQIIFEDESGTIHVKGTDEPLLIIPKNHDVRVVGIADGASTHVACGMVGVLAKVI